MGRPQIQTLGDRPPSPPMSPPMGVTDDFNIATAGGMIVGLATIVAISATVIIVTNRPYDDTIPDGEWLKHLMDNFEVMN